MASDMKGRLLAKFIESLLPEVKPERIDEFFPYPSTEEREAHHIVVGKAATAKLDFSAGANSTGTYIPKPIREERSETPAEPANDTDNNVIEREFDPVGKLLVFSPDHDDEVLAGKKLLIAEKVKKGDGYIGFFLNKIVGPRLQNFGQHTQNADQSCHARGKLIPISEGGKQNPSQRPTFITELASAEKMPKDTYTTLDKLLISNHVAAYNMARAGQFDPERTIICIGSNAFANKLIADFIRDPDCAIMAATPDHVFSRKTSPETLFQTGKTMALEEDGEAVDVNSNGPSALLN